MWEIAFDHLSNEFRDHRTHVDDEIVAIRSTLGQMCEHLGMRKEGQLPSQAVTNPASKGDGKESIHAITKVGISFRDLVCPIL